MAIELKTIPADARCGTCRWYEDIEIVNGIKDRGWCHRYPPIYNGEKWESAEQEIERFNHPTVERVNFCGEWAADLKQSTADDRKENR